MSETIGVLRPTSTDLGHGDTRATYPDEPTHTIAGVDFDPGGSTENHDGRDAVITTPTLYLPAGADVRATDHLLVRGLTYEADGDLADWAGGDDPYDFGGIVQKIKRVAG